MNGGGIMKKIKNKIIILLLIITISFVSCYNNIIIFDMENSCLYSKDNNIISYIHIYMVKHDITYSVKIKDKKRGLKKLYINKIENNYEIKDIKYNKSTLLRVDINRILTLVPNEEYHITNVSFGDARSYVLILRTDAVGKIEE